MATAKKTSYETKRYANLIPMKEIQSVQDQLFPFTIYNTLRKKTPVRYDPIRECWDVFRYEDVHFILKNPALFSSNRGIDDKRNSILIMDPPKHTKMRNLINKTFTPKAVNELSQRIQDVTTSLLDQAKEKETLEMIRDFAAPLPVIIIAELLGVPAKDRELFKNYSDILVSGAEDDSDEAFNMMMKRRREGAKFLNDYFKEIIQERQRSPKDDLISLLLAAEVDGERLKEEELLGFCILLLVAGNETTTNLIVNAVRYMVEDTNTQETVRKNLSLVPNLIEETLRFYPPIQAIGRTATADVEIGGHTIRKGSQVISWVAAANRDEQKFEQPDRFMLERHPNPHLGFGYGIHFCLGAPLARLEAKVALSVLLTTFSKLELAKHTELEPIQSPFVFGVKSFPIQFSL
ncbi:cytochrome P450 [Bacillus smithii]|uniref:cytochrome P450 n=1 Tax=Bacillus smithii TaxID=1479 RepID=UPI002E1FC377|nr:cytochrome P450 [Bacillus smithii]MED1455800.1 cytochrome P450 [Bacillus smithii]